MNPILLFQETLISQSKLQDFEKEKILKEVGK